MTHHDVKCINYINGKKSNGLLTGEYDTINMQMNTWSTEKGL